jgi:hypothetical protein
VLRCLFAALILLLAVQTARASKRVPPWSWTKVSGDFVFVMLPDDAVSEADWWKADVGRMTEILRIRATWPQSGLYRNDGSRTPLWGVNWFDYPVLVEIASDGVHLVRLGYDPPQSDDKVVSFFASGRQVRQYRLDELVRDPTTLKRTGSGYLWYSTNHLDDDTSTFSVETRNGERYKFDLRTGEIVAQSRPWPTWLRVSLLVLAGLVEAALTVWLVRILKGARRVSI